MLIGRPIGPEHLPFTIAETSLNHCGSLARALAMIRLAKEAGCDAVKFQTFRAEDVCPPDQVWTYRTQGKTVTEPRIEVFRRCELPDAAWPALKAECDRQGIVFLSTPETPRDLDFLLELGIPAIKIGSDNLTNRPMLQACALAGKPIILSTGMSDWVEIAMAMGILGRAALLVCTSEYPCPPEAANLGRIATLRNNFASSPIGLSDHTQGTTAAVAAVAMGASILECHFTLDRKLPGPDHWWAKTPEQLKQWAHHIREAWTMLGSGSFTLSEQEQEAKERYQRSAS